MRTQLINIQYKTGAVIYQSRKRVNGLNHCSHEEQRERSLINLIK